jgi:hypothetical protein
MGNGIIPVIPERGEPDGWSVIGRWDKGEPVKVPNA